ncbi:MAG: ornithine cyclodeaminase family protein [Candidatus Delongbacteria bacterium]|nr:ornithine cyclodeaminase family protein [Candidatus Delongbacteria bacterium]
MLVLNAEDIRKVFTMEDAINSNEEAFVIQSNRKAEVPVRINFDVKQNGITSYMPALIKDFPVAGIKIVSTYPDNGKKGLPAVTATTFLNDPETGEINVMLDGTELTRMRTGAVSGLATKLLSNEDSETAALFGTGGQAMSQLEAILTVRKISEVRIYDSNNERIKSFAERASGLAEKFNARLIAVDSSDAAIDAADIITTVTTSAVPVFDGQRLKEGSHVNAVGVFMPHKRELDEYTVTHADKIFIDNTEAIMSEAGEFLIPISEGKFKKESITGELGDLILGKVMGRTDSEQITLMKTVGFATLDIVIAYNVYKKAVKAGVGRVF